MAAEDYPLFVSSLYEGVSDAGVTRKRPVVGQHVMVDDHEAIITHSHDDSSFNYRRIIDGLVDDDRLYGGGRNSEWREMPDFPMVGVGDVFNTRPEETFTYDGMMKLPEIGQFVNIIETYEPTDGRGWVDECTGIYQITDTAFRGQMGRCVWEGPRRRGRDVAQRRRYIKWQATEVQIPTPPTEAADDKPADVAGDSAEGGAHDDGVVHQMPLDLPAVGQVIRILTCDSEAISQRLPVIRTVVRLTEDGRNRGYWYRGMISGGEADGHGGEWRICSGTWEDASVPLVEQEKPAEPAVAEPVIYDSRERMPVNGDLIRILTATGNDWERYAHRFPVERTVHDVDRRSFRYRGSILQGAPDGSGKGATQAFRPEWFTWEYVQPATKPAEVAAEPPQVDVIFNARDRMPVVGEKIRILTMRNDNEGIRANLPAERTVVRADGRYITYDPTIQSGGADAPVMGGASAEVLTYQIVHPEEKPAGANETIYHYRDRKPQTGERIRFVGHTAGTRNGGLTFPHEATILARRNGDAPYFEPGFHSRNAEWWYDYDYQIIAPATVAEAPAEVPVYMSRPLHDPDLEYFRDILRDRTHDTRVPQARPFVTGDRVRVTHVSGGGRPAERMIGQEYTALRDGLTLYADGLYHHYWVYYELLEAPVPERVPVYYNGVNVGATGWNRAAVDGHRVPDVGQRITLVHVPGIERHDGRTATVVRNTDGRTIVRIDGEDRDEGDWVFCWSPAVLLVEQAADLTVYSTGTQTPPGVVHRFPEVGERVRITGWGGRVDRNPVGRVVEVRQNGTGWDQRAQVRDVETRENWTTTRRFRYVRVGTTAAVTTPAPRAVPTHEYPAGPLLCTHVELTGRGSTAYLTEMLRDRPERADTEATLYQLEEGDRFYVVWASGQRDQRGWVIYHHEEGHVTQYMHGEAEDASFTLRGPYGYFILDPASAEEKAARRERLARENQAKFERGEYVRVRDFGPASNQIIQVEGWDYPVKVIAPAREDHGDHSGAFDAMMATGNCPRVASTALWRPWPDEVPNVCFMRPVREWTVQEFKDNCTVVGRHATDQNGTGFTRVQMMWDEAFGNDQEYEHTWQAMEAFRRGFNIHRGGWCGTATRWLGCLEIDADQAVTEEAHA